MARTRGPAGGQGRVAALPTERLPEHLRSGINTAQDLVVDSIRIRQERGYRESVGQEEALRRAIAWERAHPPAQVDPKQFDYAAEDAALDSAGDRQTPACGASPDEGSWIA